MSAVEAVRRPLVVAAVAVAVLGGAACAAPPATPPTLGEVVAATWPDGSLPRGPNVSWTVGAPPDGYAAWTAWTCALTRCSFTVTVAAAYITAAVVAHEGGHVVCVSLWQDGSEACAAAVAGELLRGAP